MKFFILKLSLIIVLSFLVAGFVWEYYCNSKFGVVENKNYRILPDSLKSGISEAVERESGPPELFATVRNEKKYQNIISRLDSAKQINNGRVGFCGVYTWENACFDRLKIIATDEELIYLLRHKNPIVRGYSFKALAARNKSLAQKQLWKIENDTCVVEEMSGDCGLLMPLGFFAKEWCKN
jgi:hypothetical protein